MNNQVTPNYNEIPDDRSDADMHQTIDKLIE